MYPLANLACGTTKPKMRALVTLFHALTIGVKILPKTIGVKGYSYHDGKSLPYFF